MDNTESNNAHKNSGCLRTLGIMLVTVIISIIASVLVVNHYLFPKKFAPVELNRREASSLNDKLRQFGLPATLTSDDEKSVAANELKPEAYTEKGAKREISFSEKELNALLANNTDLSDKVAIDLADNLASTKVIIPFDPDFPVFGGKTLKASAGAEFSYAHGRPVVILKGVSVWGVPVPNAWLGNLKNVDLVKEFGGDEGFWKTFAEGVESIRVEEGELKIKLSE